MSNSKCAGIYSITSKVNGKRYIGSSVRICERWNRHIRDLKNNKHRNSHLQRHYNKYGKDDLLFAVVEIIERESLSLKDFKELLLEREQIYLNNWKECHFNMSKVAKMILGYQTKKCKNYSYDKDRKVYRVYFQIDLKRVLFGSYNTEKEAIDEIIYIRSLSDKDKIKYHETKFKYNKGSKIGSRNKDNKGYFFDNTHQRWKVSFVINKSIKIFGSFKTEEEAKEKANQVKKELGGFN